MQYALEMQPLELENLNDLLTGAVLTAIHSVSVRNSKQIIPEMVGFVVKACEAIRKELPEGRVKYAPVEFEQAVQMLMLENHQESHILLHSILRVLDGLLIANPKLYNMNSIRQDLKRTLTELKKQLSAEPYL